MAEEIVDPKYGQLDADMVAMLRSYEIRYFREDLPVPFADGLLIYPATVRDFEEFANCSSCLTLNKNNDPEGIRMSNLDYLLAQAARKDAEGQVWIYRIHRLFSIIFHVKDGYECLECHNTLAYDSPEVTKFMKECTAFVAALEKSLAQNSDEPPKEEETPPEPTLTCPSCGKEHFRHAISITEDPTTHKRQLAIHGHVITKKEFNQLRQIVLFQNFPDYVDDSWVDPELKKDRDEKMQLEQRSNDLHASIEKKVVCLSVTTNYKFDEIFNMSIRKFTMALSTVDDLINYKLLKQAQYSGFSGLPKNFKVDHWIYKPNKDMYGDAYKDIDTLKAV